MRRPVPLFAVAKNWKPAPPLPRIYCGVGGELNDAFQIACMAGEHADDDGPIATAIHGWPPPALQCVLRTGHRGPHRDYRGYFFDYLPPPRDYPHTIVGALAP